MTSSPDSASRLADARLVAQISSRKQSALEEAYRCHAATVTSVARRVLGDPTAAEEVAQVVFLRLWDRPDRYEPGRGSLRSFLCADSHGRSVDQVRSDVARRRRETAERAPADPFDDGPAAAAERDEARERVRRAVDGLPEDERDAIGWAYFRGCTYREVATILGSPEGTVKSCIRRGLRRLRADLGDLDVGLTPARTTGTLV